MIGRFKRPLNTIRRYTRHGPHAGQPHQQPRYDLEETADDKNETSSGHIARLHRAGNARQDEEMMHTAADEQSAEQRATDNLAESSY